MADPVLALSEGQVVSEIAIRRVGVDGSVIDEQQWRRPQAVTYLRSVVVASSTGGAAIVNNAGLDASDLDVTMDGSGATGISNGGNLRLQDAAFEMQGGSAAVGLRQTTQPGAKTMVRSFDVNLNGAGVDSSGIVVGTGTVEGQAIAIRASGPSAAGVEVFGGDVRLDASVVQVLGGSAIDVTSPFTTVRIGASRLQGTITEGTGTITCFGTYDDLNAPRDGDC